MRVDLTGRRFGRLVALEASGRDRRRTTLWRCQCDCGRTAVLPGDRLQRGGVTSCGCGHRDKTTGERHHSARLTAELVVLARKLDAQGYSLGEIADHLPVRVDKSTLSLAVSGKTWKSVPRPASYED